MKNENSINVERRLKKHVYSRCHRAVIVTCPGFQEVSKAECLALTENRVEISGEDKNRLLINKISFDDLMRLVAFGKTIDDVFLELEHFRWKGVEDFQSRLVNSDSLRLFPDNVSVVIKIEIFKSHFKNKERLLSLTEQIFCKNQESLSPKPSDQFHLFIQLARDTIRIFVSLPGKPLYQRGYKNLTNTDAPLRETIAAATLKKFFLLHNKSHLFETGTLLVPFGGSGTFIFEFLSIYYNLSNRTHRDEFSFQNFRQFPFKKWDFLTKNNFHKSPSPKIFYWDTSEKSIETFFKNWEKFFNSIPSDLISQNALALDVKNSDFLKSQISSASSHEFEIAFLPLNPPYGLRLKKSSTDLMYKQLGAKINEISKKYKVLNGFVFCPTENTWRAVLGELAELTTTTSHFMQGGLDIRCLMFSSSKTDN